LKIWFHPDHTACGGSTVVKHSHHNPKVESLSSASGKGNNII